MANQIGKLEVGVRLKVDDAEVQRLRNSLVATGDAGAKAIDKGLTNRLGQLGTNATRAGRQITFGLSLPMAAAGKSATDTYLRFDQSMTRIEALVGVNRKTVEEWGEEVKRIGGTYGRTADETADALYFISSSGFEGANAMKLLETSAKASATGLGTVTGIADTLSSALNAYGQQNLSASKAADILTVAVREGKAEADQMGSALASVISPASTLGISFGELAGAMASMTLTGSSPDEVATQLGALMSTLTDMPPIAQRALKQYTGLEYATLRMNLANKGLIPTLQGVFAAFEGNEAAMSEVFGNIRAWRGVMNLFGESTGNTLRIIGETTKASGELDAAFDKTAMSSSHRMEVAMAKLNIAMTDIGAAVAPAVTTVVGGVAKIASAFDALPGPAKNVAVGIGLVAAASGPLVYSVGAMIQVANGAQRAITALRPAFESVALRAMYFGDMLGQSAQKGTLLRVGMTNLQSGLLAGGVVLAGLAVAHHLWNQRMDESRQKAAQLGEVFKKAASKGGIGAAQDTINRTNREIEGLNRLLADSPQWQLWDEDYRNDLRMGREELERNVEATRSQVRLAKEMAAARKLDENAVYDWLAAEASAGRTYANAKDGLDAFNKAMKDHQPAAQQVIDDTKKMEGGFGNLIAEVQATSDAFFGTLDAERKYRDALTNITDAKQGVTDAEKAHADAIKNTNNAQRRLTEAESRAKDATNRLTEARTGLVDAQRDLNDALRGPSVDEQLDIESSAIALEEARRRLRDLGKTEPGEKRKPVDPLDRRRAQLDVRRAELDYQRALASQSGRVADARKKVVDQEKAVADAVQAELDAKQAVIDARDAQTEASVRQAEARDKITEAQARVTQAELDAVGPAMDLAAKQEALASAFANGTFHGSAFTEYLTKLKDLYPELAGQIQSYIDKVSHLRALEGKRELPNPPEGEPSIQEQEADVFAYLAKLGGETERMWKRLFEDARKQSEAKYREALIAFWTPSIAAIAGRRRFGGPVEAGQRYEVNEGGVPELFTARGRQYLIPVGNGRVTPLDSAGTQAREVNIGDIYVSGPDPVATAVETRRKLRTKAFLAGA